MILEIFASCRRSNNKSKEPAGPAKRHDGGQALALLVAALRDLIRGGAGVAGLIFENGNFRLNVVVLLLEAGEFILPIVWPHAAEVPILADLFP